MGNPHFWFAKERTVAVKISVPTIKQAMIHLLNQQEASPILWEKSPYIFGFHSFNKEGNLDITRLREYIKDLTIDSTMRTLAQLLTCSYDENVETNWEIFNDHKFKNLYHVIIELPESAWRFNGNMEEELDKRIIPVSTDGKI